NCEGPIVRDFFSRRIDLVSPRRADIAGTTMEGGDYSLASPRNSRALTDALAAAANGRQPRRLPTTFGHKSASLCQVVWGSGLARRNRASRGYAAASTFSGTSFAPGVRGGSMTASASLPTAARRGDAAAPPNRGAKPAAKDGAEKPDSGDKKPGADGKDVVAKKDGGDKKATAKAETPKRPPKRWVRKISARRRLQLALPPLAFAAVVTAGLLYGWQNSDEGYLTPESGIGYALGIIGGSAMLLLLGYPLRKRLASLKIIGGVTS